MKKKYFLFQFIASILLFIFISGASAANIGETVPIEGYVDSAGKNSLYVSGKILVANEYSSINTGGSNIFIGDYVMGFIYLNDDMQSYTIVSLTKIPEKSIGTSTPLPRNTPTPLWADLFTPTPAPQDNGLRLLSDTGTESSGDTGSIPLQNNPYEQILPAPTATPSSVSFEGTVSNVDGGRIFVDGIEYITDNSTGYKDGVTGIDENDYVRGRAAPYPGALVIRYIEVLEDYERPDLETRTVWGLYQSQDYSKMIVELPEGELKAYFYPGTKMSKTFFTKGTLVSLEMAGKYVKSSSDYPLVQSGDSITPVNGVIDEAIRFSDNENYIVSSNLAYFVNSETRLIPDGSGLKKRAPFVGLMRNGRIITLYFTENNRVKTINGAATSVKKTPDGKTMDFIVGGVEYHINPESVVEGSNLIRHSEITGYADSANNVFYMSFRTPWYSQMKDWNWTVIVPAAVSFLALVFFLLLHKTKTEGYVQEVKGNIITISDSRGDEKRHFRCTDETARYASSFITMKVELTVYHGKVIHIRYQF